MTDTSLDIKLESTGAVLAGRASVSDYIALLKPRVMSLVVFSGFAGLIAAPGTLHPLLAAVAVLCIAVSAGAAGAINMWYDRDIDAIMERTKSRPLPQGRVSADEALSFGVTLTLFSTMLMGLAVNWTAAILLISANAFYVFIYTMWLKRSTPYNIVIGGAAGAFPPMIGWAAVTGSVELQSIVLFLIIFMWTPPHFWALALFREIDYAKAGVPMLPVVAGTRATKWQMLLYTLVLVPITLLPSFLGTAGPVYGVAAFLLGLRFIHLAVKVLRDEGVRYTKPMFGFSILYLFALFALLMLDRSPGILANLGLIGGAG